jgi:hypothetical protein
LSMISSLITPSGNSFNAFISSLSSFHVCFVICMANPMY